MRLVSSCLSGGSTGVLFSAGAAGACEPAIACRALGPFEQREMRHQQAAQLALGLFRRFHRPLLLAPNVGDRIAVAGDLALVGQTRLFSDEVGLLMRRRFDLVRRALSEHQGVLQRLFDRFEMTYTLLEVRDLRLESGSLLCLVFERLDDFVEKLIDVGAFVALKRLLETLVLYVDWCDLFHRFVSYGLLPMKSKVPSAIIESRKPAAFTTMPAGTTR